MRKVSLKNLGKDEILTRDELKLIMGGTTGSGGGYGTFRCNCYDSSIVWEARYKSVEDMVNYIYGTCSNGGNCTAV